MQIEATPQIWTIGQILVRGDCRVIRRHAYPICPDRNDIGGKRAVISLNRRDIKAKGPRSGLWRAAAGREVLAVTGSCPAAQGVCPLCRGEVRRAKEAWRPIAEIRFSAMQSLALEGRKDNEKTTELDVP